MKKRNLKYVIGLLAIVGIGFTALKLYSGNNQSIEISTEKIGRSDIRNAVTATGTLEASITVKVGTQVSGRIAKLFVDYNTKVKKDQLIALLDTEPLKSSLESSKGTMDQATADYEYQKKIYERSKQLVTKKLIAQEDFDKSEFNYKSSLANLNSARAKYSKDKINLDYAYIYSPIDGIVLERNIEEGETVAASFTTPTLFTIVNDLTQMEIKASVDEADIGQVKVGQRVEFTVDAYPDMTFEGEVKEIHLVPVTTSNVVTYTVVIRASNPNQTLMPGMTANVTFLVTEKKNVLVIPGKAFDFKPDPILMESYRENYDLEIRKTDLKPQAEERIVWIKKKDGSIYSQAVKIGETDEINYEVISGVNEGDEVVISMISKSPTKVKKGNETGKSPFMPTPPSRSKKKQ